MKCDISTCKAQCCYNVPLPVILLNICASQIINPILYTEQFDEVNVVPVTDEDRLENKCPFLREDYLCNIYDRRPELCRKFGTDEHPMLKCKFVVP